MNGRRSKSGLCRLAIAAAAFGLAAVAGAVDKNGVSANAINVPNGPGTIEGMGQTFEPQLNTGSSEYGLPLVVNIGTRNFQPELALSYSSGSGNSVLGYGWSMSIPYVERRTGIGVPRYVDGPNFLDDDGDGLTDEPDEGPADAPTDEIDKFVNEQGSTLVAMTDGTYFNRFEGDFVRYRRVADYWEATLPNGVVLIFGRSPEARTFDPDTTRVARWWLERSTDTNGNSITYRYVQFPGAHNLNQRYLAEIQYGPGAPPWTAFHYVVFRYEPRPDWFQDGRFGFQIATGMRLSEILVASQGLPLEHLRGDFNADGIEDQLTRRYHLEYATHPHWSLLSSVQVIGADGVNGLPPGRFFYNPVTPAATIDAADQFIGGINEPTTVMDNPLVELVDLNGDALPDVLRTEFTGGAHTAWINRGEEQTDAASAIRWEGPVEVATADGLAWQADLSSANPVTRLADMDGDGLADLVMSNSLAGAADVAWFRNTGQVAWGPRQQMVLSGDPPPSPFAQPDTRQADIDNNNKIDIIQSVSVGNSADYRVWFNLGENVFSERRTVPQNAGIPFELSNSDVTDFDGDGLADVVRIRPQVVTVLAGLGYGRFAEPVDVPIPDGPLDELLLQRAGLHDLTGDGLPELVIERPAPGTLWYWINLGNLTFDVRRDIVRLPAVVGEQTTLRWADLNGNGTEDLIYVSRFTEPRMQCIDIGRLIGCVPGPNLLTRVENGIGGTTAIEYSRSTLFALADFRAGRPWPDIMPNPIEVVSRILTSDGLGHTYEKQFVYHDGYHDPKFKAFRGFYEVEQHDIGEQSAPTGVTRFFFDTGRTDLARKGKLLRQRSETATGEIFDDVATEWDTRTLYLGVDDRPVEFARATRTLRDITERGQGTPRRLEMEYDHDQYGNVIREANYGIVEPGNRGAFQDEQIKLNNFAIDTSRWMLRSPSREEVRDLAGNVASRVEYFYDDPTFSASNFGAVSRGNVTLKKAWNDPVRQDGFVMLNRFKYDIFGNPVVVLSPLASAPGGEVDLTAGHVRIVDFDSLLHILATRETVYLGGGKEPIVQQAEYDLALGVMKRMVDFAGQRTLYKHDNLARFLGYTIPGEVEEFPTEEFSYHLAQPVGDGKVINYVERLWVDKPNDFGAPFRGHYHVSRTFTDGLGREVLRKEEAEPDSSGTARVSVQGVNIFNARMGVAGVMQPFYTTLPGDLESKLVFENIEAPGWSGLFHQNGDLVPLSLQQAHRNQITYDSLSRELENRAVDGAVHRNIYQPLVELVYDENDTDPNSPHFNTPTRLVRDGLERIVRVEEQVRLAPNGAPSTTLNTWTTRYAYDTNSELSRYTDAQGNVRVLQYDGLQRLVHLNDPDRGERVYTYDAASNMSSMRDARGQETRFTYDGANRILTEDYVGIGQTPDVAYGYDTPTGLVDIGSGDLATAQYTGGRLVYVRDTAGEYFVSYDIAGGTDWMVRTLLDATNNVEQRFTSYTAWDTIGRLVAYQFPDGDSIDVFYNDLGVPERITGGELIHPDGNPNVLDDTEQTPGGQMLRSVFGNGIVNTWSYDARGRMSTLRTGRPGSVPPLMYYGYQFDPLNNVTKITDLRPGAALPGADRRRNTQDFAYDDAYRLVQARYFNTPNGTSVSPTGTINFQYSPAGNLLAQTSDIPDSRNGRPLLDIGSLRYGGASGQDGREGRPGADPGPHAMSSTSSGASVAYDANGNVSGMDGLQFRWDFEDRLEAIEGPTMRAEYQYDYTDARKSKRVWRRASPTDPWPVQPSEVALYPTSTFELREGGQSFKHIFQDKTRVARIAGTLNPQSERLQQFQLFEGWNLIALAVDATDAAEQLSLFSNSTLRAVMRWDGASSTFVPLTPEEPLPARSVLWLFAEATQMLSLRGAFDSAQAQLLPGGEGYLAAPDLSGAVLRAFLPESTLSYQFFDAARQRWISGFYGDLSGLSQTDAPPRLVAGQAVYVRASAEISVTAPPATPGIQYYHLDHVASSNIVTDGAGELLFESAYYPYGEPRNDFVSLAAAEEIPKHYAFASKEQDRESGLHYFDARYLSGVYGRFLSVDPLVDELPQDMLLDPQSLHPYAYSRNNPLAFGDPTGRKPVILFRKEDDDKDVKEKVFAKYWGWVPVRATDSSMFKKKAMFDKLSPGLKVMLHSMAREDEEDPGMYLKFRDKMKGLGLKGEAIKITDDRGVILKSGLGKGGQTYVTEKQLMDAAEKEFNLRASIWLSKKLQRFAKPENRIDIDQAVELMKATTDELDFEKFGKKMKELQQVNKAGMKALERRKGKEDEGVDLP